MSAIIMGIFPTENSNNYLSFGRNHDRNTRETQFRDYLRG